MRIYCIILEIYAEGEYLMNLFGGNGDIAVLVIIGILVFLVILSIGIIVRNSRLNRDEALILSKINQSVSEINDKVGRAGLAQVQKTEQVQADDHEEQLQVVFIDNRVDTGAAQSTFVEGEKAEDDHKGGKVIKFTDFNCATDKKGNTHTLEELREQIR